MFVQDIECICITFFCFGARQNPARNVFPPVDRNLFQCIISFNPSHMHNILCPPNYQTNTDYKMLKQSLVTFALLCISVCAQDPSALSQSSIPQGTCQNSNDSTCKANLQRGTDTHNENVADNYEECKEWAQQGECLVNPRFMYNECRKSCLGTRHKDDVVIGSSRERSDTCQLYMAPSSIPFSGLGMYTAAPLAYDEVIYYPDIIVNYLDFQHHAALGKIMEQQENPKYQEIFEEKMRGRQLKDQNSNCRYWASMGECTVNPNYMLTACAKSCVLEDILEDEEGEEKPKWLPDDYYWDASSVNTNFEADEVSSLVPGLGALANSHAGLNNAVMMRTSNSNDSAGYHRSRDPGVGGFSTHHNLGFKTDRDLPAGMELFVDYGDSWFSQREHKFGPIPLTIHFRDANRITSKFLKLFDRSSIVEKFLGKFTSDDTSYAEDLWNLTRELTPLKRHLMALPTDYKKAFESKGKDVALLTVPDVQRSTQWLEENGICLDNIYVEQSTVPQAGRGAFATRKIKKGDVIAPLPLIQMEKERMRMYEEDEDGWVTFQGYQLILNYSYGHKSSSIVFFPYSPIVNYVNHNFDKTKINARLRWSTSKYHKADWQTETTTDILNKPGSGLILEFIASRDIGEDEEIFIDYGAEWESAWLKHVEEWQPQNDPNYMSLHRLNSEPMILTAEEQQASPYPANAKIICFLNDSHLFDDAKKKMRTHEFQWADYKVNDNAFINAIPCTPKTRGGDEGKSFYTVAVKQDEKMIREILVANVPRSAMEFVDEPYQSDQHIRNVFRHEIHIPDEIFPPSWKDLHDYVDNNDERTLHDDTTTLFVNGKFVHWDQKEESYEQCRYYLAESSIPGAGLGIYTGINIKPGDFTKNELVIPTFDYRYQHETICEAEEKHCEDYHWANGSYEWSASMCRATYDADDVYISAPGMGALPNTHPGLANGMVMPSKNDGGGLHRSKHPGAGAVTAYSSFRHAMTKSIPAGREIFIGYGDSYLESRPQIFESVPRNYDFTQANLLLKRFATYIQDSTNITSEALQEEWSFERDQIITSTRVRNALPENVTDVIRAAQIGSELYSVPNAQRSLEWLEENGRCLDKIEVGPSKIPEAGRGAIARTAMKKGDIITTSPMLPFNRKFLHLRDRDEDSEKINIVSEQLILNYCFGHAQSDVLLFPLAPAVTAINHASPGSSNTRIQWSSFPYHKSHLLNSTSSEILSAHGTGLIIDLIATRDIEEGEEITIDYGPDWQTAWNDHVSEWEPWDTEDYRSSWDLNNSEDYIMTIEEGEYPQNINIRCGIPTTIFESDPQPSGEFEEVRVWWEEHPLMFMNAWEQSLPCEILQRELIPSKESPSKTLEFYTANIFDEDGEFVVVGIPRDYIYFVDAPYSSDCFLPNVFRHHIGVPDDMFPDSWKYREDE